MSSRRQSRSQGLLPKTSVALFLLAASVGPSACKRPGGQQEIRTTVKTFFEQAASGDAKACDLASARYKGQPANCLRDAALAGSPNVTEKADAVNEIKVKDGNRRASSPRGQG